LYQEKTASAPPVEKWKVTFLKGISIAFQGEPKFGSVRAMSQVEREREREREREE
jgi:hypothetical protein